MKIRLTFDGKADDGRSEQERGEPFTASWTLHRTCDPAAALAQADQINWSPRKAEK